MDPYQRMRSLQHVHEMPAAERLLRRHRVPIALSLLAGLAHGCSLDTRKLTATDEPATQHSAEAGTPVEPEPDADSGDNPSEHPVEASPGTGETAAGSGQEPVDSGDEPVEPPIDPASDGGTPEPVDCCALPVASGGCAEIDETCHDPAAIARMEQVRAMVRALLRSSAFAECLNRTMRVGEDDTATSIPSLPSGGCGGQTPEYQGTGFGPYVSCRPEIDRSQGGQPITGTSHGDAAWNELVDRQLARLLNALNVEVALTPVAAPADAGIRSAGYDPISGISHVTYPGPPSELTLPQAVGTQLDGAGFVPDVIRATLRNLGYDDGCYPDERPLGKDHGNCGRDPVMWHPDRALTNIAAFCAKEILLRSASREDTGCGTESGGTQETLRPCPQGLMMVSTYQAYASEFPCHCVPDPAAFGAHAAGERFGAAFAIGDFDGTMGEDLAVGAPNALFPGKPGRGGVFLYRGSRLGLQPWRSVSSADLKLGRDDAECGATLAAGLLGPDSNADLVIGCPGYDSGQGRVALLPGCRSDDCPDGVEGPQVALKQVLAPFEPGEFGRALAIGQFLGDDDLNDLFVGAPAAAGMVPLSGLVEMYRGLAEGPLVEHERTLNGVDSFDRFGAAIAIGDVQSTPGNELLVGAPGTAPGSANPAGAGVLVVSAAGVAPLQSSLQEGGGFGSAIAIGDLFGDDFDDIIITAPGEGKLYRSIGGSTRPGAPGVVASFPTHPATSVAVVMAQVFSADQLVLVGRPGVKQATLYRPSGSELVVDRHLHPSALPFWSAAHDPLASGHCSKRGDLGEDVPCAIDAVTLPGESFGSAVGAGLFGMGVQFVIGAPDENVGLAPPVSAGAVFVRGGQRGYDASITWIDPLEARIDRQTILHSGTPYARGFGPARRWHDDLCAAGESCTATTRYGRTDLVVWSRDVPGKQGDVSIAPTTLTSFGPAVRWQDNFCSGRALCAIGRVDQGSEPDLVVFVRDSIAGHEYHVHVVRCAGCAVEEWHRDFCHDGNVCLVGDIGSERSSQYGDDIIEINPQLGTQVIALSSSSAEEGFVRTDGVLSEALCANGHLCLLADVNGDYRDDIVEFFQGDNAEVWVAPALQSRVGFGPARKWHPSFCRAGEQCRVGDVNGDQLHDLVSFVREATPGQEGNVWVSLSNGVDFGPAELWHPDLCRGTQTCELGDVNGDTRSDVVVFVGSAPGAQNNDVNVALSLP